MAVSLQVLEVDRSEARNLYRIALGATPRGSGVAPDEPDFRFGFPAGLSVDISAQQPRGLTRVVDDDRQFTMTEHIIGYRSA